MAGRWFDPLRHLSEEARRAAPTAYSTDVVLFYLARWCQKKAGRPQPRVASFEQTTLRDVAERIARHLAEHGPLVERIVHADRVALTELRRELRESVGPRSRARAEDYAEEALQKIAEVLLTGTSPSQAAERLREGPRGPSNEYIFESPFLYWARRVALNLITDEERREARDRKPPPPRAQKPAPHLDRDVLKQACAALPELLQAIRELRGKQRSVMILSLNRRDLDEVVRGRLHELATDLFSEAGPLVSSDKDIAERMGSTPHRVAANRSAARRRLAKRDPLWALLLDALLPHKSTRPPRAEANG